MDNSCYVAVGNYQSQKIVEFVPSSKANISEAIRQGCDGISMFTYDAIPTDDDPHPLQQGDLIISLQRTGNENSLMKNVKKMLTVLRRFYAVDPADLQYWLCSDFEIQIGIPASMFGLSHGNQSLSFIYSSMIRILCAKYKDFACNSVNLNIYDLEKSPLLKVENTPYSDGRYKVPFESGLILSYDFDTLVGFTSSPQSLIANDHIPKPSIHLTELFRSFERIANNSALLKQIDFWDIFRCPFVCHCAEMNLDLPENEWNVFVKIFSAFGQYGLDVIRDFCRDHPQFDEKRLELMVTTAQAKKCGDTCRAIREDLCFDCQNACGTEHLETPAHLALHARSLPQNNRQPFELRPDGLYYVPHPELDSNGSKISSYIRVLGRTRSVAGEDWSRLIEIISPDHQRKQLRLPMGKIQGAHAQLFALLSSHGVEISQAKGARQLLLQYLADCCPDDAIYICAKRIGWLDNKTYVLPDAIYSACDTNRIIFDAEIENPFNQQGTLHEWKENVARYCCGNSIFVLAICFAFAGPLLKPLHMEGHGLHIYGRSSSGKTTCAVVASSACGLSPSTWRVTDSALEVYAARNNDNTLFLDEISQVNFADLQQIVYMLSNGQGRGRSSPDATLRARHQWLLNYLSTGELSMEDIQSLMCELRPPGGQFVRMIDLPIDQGCGENAFAELHGLNGSRELSELLSANAKKYCGTPLRHFLQNLCSDSLDSVIADVRCSIDKFIAENRPEEASGQVLRVLKFFALIYAAGKLTSQYGIIPFSLDDICETSSKWFDIWLKQRRDTCDKEILVVLDRIREHFYIYADRYIPIRKGMSSADLMNFTKEKKSYGYVFPDEEPVKYLVLTDILNKLFKGINRKTIEDVLKKRGWVAITLGGEVQTTKSVLGHNKRGLVFIPSAWNDAEKNMDPI